MRISIVFLAVLSLVAISCQQQNNKPMYWQYGPVPYYTPRTLYYPFLAADGNGGINEMMDSPIEDEGVDEWQPSINHHPFIQSRNKNRLSSSKPQNQEQRFFFGAFNPFLSALVRTTQVTQIFSSTILSAVVTSCVPASLFVKDNPTLCSRRKRRDLIMLMDFDKAQQMQGEQDDVIAPSEVNQ